MAVTGRLDKAPLYIEDTPNIKLFDLRAQARRMKMLHDIKILFIDYLGLISVDNSNIPKHEQMSEISKSLKGLARELNIPVVALSQVGRQTEGTKPSLADIRGSGSIEQDADVVIFLYRDRKDQVEQSAEEDSDSGGLRKPLEIDVMIAKQRNGAIGDIKMHFHPQHMLFTEIETHYER
jgi:replicative DNA helicase